MNNIIYNLLAVLMLIFVVILLFIQFKKIKDLCESIGAKIKSYIPFKAFINLDGREFNINIYGGYVNVCTFSPVNGYISIKKKLSKGFNIYYDDKEWADLILKKSNLKSIIETEKFSRFFCIEINGKDIKIEFFNRKIDEEFKENIKKAIELLLEIISSLEGLPSSLIGVEKNRLRNLIIYYIPLGIFVFLFVLGIYWQVKGYGKPLCEDEIFVLGFKILTPIFIFHFLLTFLLLGKNMHFKRHILAILIIYFAGYGLIPQTAIVAFNARFDSSQPIKIETKIKSKYSAYRGGFRLILENTGCSFRVSEKLYKKAKVGDILVLYVKNGAFDVKWAYKYWIKE